MGKLTKLLPGGKLPELRDEEASDAIAANDTVETLQVPAHNTPRRGGRTPPSSKRTLASHQGEQYLWAGDQLIESAPIYADGTVAWSQATRWAYAPGGITPLAHQKAGKLWFVVTDHLGTPRELLTEAGEVEWSNSPETWGRQRLWSRPAANDDTIDCPIRFPGQYFDEESGLHYNRHRYYDPGSAQYLSPDPLNLNGGFRPQGYVHDPNGWVDPLGLKACPKREVNGTTIHGTGQKDKTPGHDQFSEIIANKLAMSGKFSDVYLDRSYNAHTGPKTVSGRRPDIMAVDHSGKIHAIELASKSDMIGKGKLYQFLTDRNRNAMHNPPSSQRGDIISIRHPYSAPKIKSALDNWLSGV